MKKLVIALSTSCLLWAGCATPTDENLASNNELNRQVQGGRYYGGIFRMNEAEYFRSLDPPSITDVYSYRIAAQLFEGLYAFNDETLEVEPRLAQKVTLDSSKTVYTFTLHEGIRFHDNKAFSDGEGRLLTAQDIAYCLTRLCTASPRNQNFHLLSGILKGADKYYRATQNGKQPAGGVEGIEVVNPRTLKLTLTQPFALFPVHLAQPGTYIYPPEAIETYGDDIRVHPVGTGPFLMGALEENISMAMPRNPKYWRKDEFGNQLPFLDALNVQFINSKKSEFFEFRKGNLDMLYRLPTEHIIEILEEANEKGEALRFKLQREPEMVSQFLAFNLSNKVFANRNLRKAFNFAIDREKILTFVLNNEGYAPGNHGITPPIFPNYAADSIQGYRLNVDSARYYLRKAGYPNGKGFPAVELALNAEGDRNTNVAVEVQKQLSDHLNIEVEIVTYPFAQLLEKGYAGNYNLLRTAWYADYPSPENFLWIFYSGQQAAGMYGGNKHPNITRYKNVTFNSLFEQALRAPTVAQANRLFRQAEQQLMNDAPIMVLWYDEAYRLLQPYVQNFPINAMQYRDLSEVYFQKARTLRSE